jgi:hypothetical protein
VENAKPQGKSWQAEGEAYVSRESDQCGLGCSRRGHSVKPSQRGVARADDGQGSRGNVDARFNQDEQDGKKTDLFGPNPQGQETRAANGQISVISIRSDLPKFVSNNRPAGTPEENKAVVQGSIAYFGMSSVNETDIVYCLLGYI